MGYLIAFFIVAVLILVFNHGAHMNDGNDLCCKKNCNQSYIGWYGCVEKW